MLSVERPSYKPGEATPLFIATLRKTPIEWGSGKVAEVPLAFTAFPYSSEQEDKRRKSPNDVKGLEGHLEWVPFGIAPHTNVHVEFTFYHRKLTRQCISYKDAARELSTGWIMNLIKTFAPISGILYRDEKGILPRIHIRKEPGTPYHVDIRYRVGFDDIFARILGVLSYPLCRFQMLTGRAHRGRRELRCS